MIVKIINWCILQLPGPGYDPVMLAGDFIGHPVAKAGSPSSFVSFDRNTLTGFALRWQDLRT